MKVCKDVYTIKRNRNGITHALARNNQCKKERNYTIGKIFTMRKYPYESQSVPPMEKHTTTFAQTLTVRLSRMTSAIRHSLYITTSRSVDKNAIGAA
jgi:hypothetical protein